MDQISRARILAMFVLDFEETLMGFFRSFIVLTNAAAPDAACFHPGHDRADGLMPVLGNHRIPTARSPRQRTTLSCAG